RLALARLTMHAGRERAPLDGALGRVATLAFQIELGALAAAEPADGTAVIGHGLYTPPLGRPAAVVPDGRDVLDRAHLESGRLQGTDGRLAAGTRPADEHLDRAHAVLECPL